MIYTVCVRNDGSQSRTVTACLQAPAGASLEAESAQSCALGPGESVCFAYPLRLWEDCGPILPPPRVQVNGLELWAERCLVEGNIPAGELAACAKRLEALLPGEPDLMKAAWEAYGDCGLFCPSSEETLRYLYWRWDSFRGDVLWRDAQQPEQDGCLYSYFGGTGVMTPELGADMSLRTQCMAQCSLRPGDIILCADDALYEKTYGCVVTADGLLGRFESDRPVETLQGADIRPFVESLQGRFCFTVFRPAMKRR